MFITTAGRTDTHMINIAKHMAKQLSIFYFHRNKQSVLAMQDVLKDDCIVVGKNRLELYPFGESEPFFFHPNSAMFRIKRLIKGEHDPFLQATELEAGMTVLDCTLGLAADSIVASFAVGETGQVVGIEANPFLAFIVKNGLNEWDSGITQMNDAMKRIELCQAHSAEFLKSQQDQSFDVVYFDPMFEEPVIESDGIKALSRFALHEDLKEEMLMDALRVARKRVVLKDHFRSSRFEKYGFDVIKRKTAKFHFGILEK
ncbi:class I SAM-dependent methyltransferase [Bacillus marasmi]|uniref:class I SAM-dependent methyltransferase n=1 Tax=Bacillus marasmi TaxID=1926279 RepID=UPI0011C80AD2|nr:class I SAM-dependent methyltransferase [Bacillus marasmi]